jgi:hypothetical protein
MLLPAARRTSRNDAKHAVYLYILLVYTAA